MKKILHNRPMELCDSDLLVDKLIRDFDDTAFPLPDIETEPHLLISKVRKHYMEYVIKLLSFNYENNQKLLDKNIYLPSAIWRCAKLIETNAAQTCMVVQLYRKNIVSVIKELKNDTNKGKLNKKLYECLRNPPENEKKLQASFGTNECNCQCTCNLRKKRPKASESPKIHHNKPEIFESALSKTNENTEPLFNIPVIENLYVDSPQMAIEKPFTNEAILQTQNLLVPNAPNMASLKPTTRLSIESQDSDELMLQLEKLFQGDSQEDDLFESGFGDVFDTNAQFEIARKVPNETQPPIQNQDSVIENHAAQIKSLDERLASLAGLLVNNNNDSNSNSAPQEKVENPKNKKHNSSKWICEEYFLKSKLYEVLDEIGDSNRKKLARIKEMLANLFGEDSEDEGVMSPLEETPEFIISCKERIAPWVVKLLTPYYIKGRIKGKALFKAVAKHLIKLIYQCSRYPHEYEVHSFVSDFLESHKVIRCEADFMQFKIDNL